jgi:tetratricopeptide (TPR) repeat protein
MPALQENGKMDVMQRWFWLGLTLGLSCAVWAQQNPAPPSPPPAASEKDPGLSRDLSFPEDDPAQPAAAKDATANNPAKKRTSSMAPPRSDRVQADDLAPGSGESSSKDTQVDLTPPADDAKAHPQSSAAVANAEASGLGGGITELHSWDPHRAAKSVEVGDFYFKRRNYRAAEDRYREALRYKDNDAVATMRLAVCLEKLGILDDARSEYESYLKILPHGPQAVEAQKAIDRLKVQTGAKQTQ